MEIDEKLKQLLIDFGPTRKSYHPEYPFWRLQNEGIWELKDAKNVRLISSGDPRRRDLMAQKVSGGLTKDIFDQVAANPETTTEMAAAILEANFPASIHEDILQAVGLDREFKTPEKRKRDPDFRDRIIRAYEYQCAVCGFIVRVGNTLVALETATTSQLLPGSSICTVAREGGIPGGSEIRDMRQRNDKAGPRVDLEGLSDSRSARRMGKSLMDGEEGEASHDA